MSEKKEAPEATYSIRRLKSVLGKAGAIFGNVAEQFGPVYYTLLTEIENDIAPEAAAKLEAEIKVIEQHAVEQVEALKAKLISTINAHIHKVAPDKLAVLYPPVSASLNEIPLQVSPIAVPPVPPVKAESGKPSPVEVDVPPARNSGEKPHAATPKSGGGGIKSKIHAVLAHKKAGHK